MVYDCLRPPQGRSMAVPPLKACDGFLARKPRQTLKNFTSMDETYADGREIHGWVSGLGFKVHGLGLGLRDSELGYGLLDRVMQAVGASRFKDSGVRIIRNEANPTLLIITNHTVVSMFVPLPKPFTPKILNERRFRSVWPTDPF